MTLKYVESPFGSPFFQLEEPKKVRYGDLPVGRTFCWEGTLYVRIPGGFKQVVGRPPKLPHTLPDDELVII